jgi:hypothetical protein
MNFYIESGTGFTYTPKESLIVLRRRENALFVGAMIGYVINSIGIFNSQWSGHLVVLIIIRDRIRADLLWGRHSGNANVLARQ